MGKKIAALLACVFAAVLFAVPTSALAAECNTLVVGGLALTPTAVDPVVYAKTDADGNLNQAGAWGGDNNVMWDGTTLTLTNATIRQVNGDSITVKDGARDIFPVTIKLVGNNSCGSISFPR